jgi:predicted ATPase
MRLDRFVGVAIHGYLNFNIRFYKDLTFLTGINGSGKTSVLNATIALITPSLSWMADVEYQLIRIELDHDGRKGFVQARKDNFNVFLSSTSTEEEFIYSKFVMTPEVPLYREAEVEQEYYSELASKNSQHPVLRFIAALPTPMFLGIDRRPRFPDESMPARRAAPRVRSRVGRNVFSASLARSLTDAESLVETRYRDSLIAVGRIGEELQGKMLQRLLAVEPVRAWNLSTPTRADIEKIKAMRRDVEALPDILRLSRDEVKNLILPFLDALQEHASRIPFTAKVQEILRDHKPDDPLIQAVLYWSVNRPELWRIKIISELVETYNARRKEETKPTDQYLDLVNGFLKDSGKKVRVDEKGYLWIVIEGVKGDKPVASLSSGEAQIFVILTHLAFNPLAQSANVFIIDEPELSLHVQWQELFVDSMMSANPKIQYILATHSPSIILERQNKCYDITRRKPGGAARA